MSADLRIAFGRCSCRDKGIRSSVRPICAALLSRLNHLRILPTPRLRALPGEESEIAWIEGRRVTFTTYRDALADGKTLIVTQAFVSTFAWPTYISLNRVGHLLADGLIVGQDGQIEDAPDNMLWDYR